MDKDEILRSAKGGTAKDELDQGTAKNNWY
jgi:hypothetical protein